MKRRDFMGRSAVGMLLLAAPAAAFRGYAEVDPALFAGINRVRDPERRSALEAKHAPRIDAPETVRAGEAFDVTVAVGEIVHPMSAGHYIAYLELLAGNEPAGRAEFRPGFSAPVVTFRLAVDRPLTLVARAYCNLHGLWESRRELALPPQ